MSGAQTLSREKPLLTDRVQYAKQLFLMCEEYQANGCPLIGGCKESWMLMLMLKSCARSGVVENFFPLDGMEYYELSLVAGNAATLGS